MTSAPLMPDLSIALARSNMWLWSMSVDITGKFPYSLMSTFLNMVPPDVVDLEQRGLCFACAKYGLLLSQSLYRTGFLHSGQMKWYLEYP